MDRNTQLDIALGVLAVFTPKKGAKSKTNDKTELSGFKGDLAGHVIALSDRRKKLQDYMFNHQREKNRFEKWGEFDPKDFSFLSENGINAYLYDITLASYKENAKDIPVIPLSEDKKNNSVRLLAFDRIPHENPFPIPERPLSVINERNSIRKSEMVNIEAELTSLSIYKKQLEAEKKTLLSDLEFEAAHAGMEFIDESMESARDMAVSCISGYAPASDIGTLKRASSENCWAFCADDPAEDDLEVPTKLKNNRITQLIYPLTDFLEMSPGYRETDISGWFLLFFTLFFGMIFGDAAYGAILLLVSLFCIAKTSKKGTPLIFKFLLLMSISNFIWGLLTCAWFGINTAQVPQILQNISLPLIVNTSATQGWIASYNAGNFWIQAGLATPLATVELMDKAITNNLMLFCFSVALVQLSIAHIRGVIANIKSPLFLAEIGQLGMLFGMYFVVLSLVVFNTGFGGVLPWQFGCLAGGFFLVFVFGNYEGSVLKSILKSCANILTNVLGITNVFSDIMSYIRLWAVGLAGASIASTVDGFVGSMVVSHLIFFIFGIALFIFGHCFNMVLNVLSVLVHGVRLNTLEFSSHVGLTWSGFAYKPFAKR
jgi:V/A-type H+-transporting ATPase subunit I